MNVRRIKTIRTEYRTYGDNRSSTDTHDRKVNSTLSWCGEHCINVVVRHDHHNTYLTTIIEYDEVLNIDRGPEDIVKNVPTPQVKRLRKKINKLNKIMNDSNIAEEGDESKLTSKQKRNLIKRIKKAGKRINKVNVKP